MEFLLHDGHSFVLLALDFELGAHDSQPADDVHVPAFEAAACVATSASRQRWELSPTVQVNVIALARHVIVVFLQVAARREQELLRQVAQRVIDSSINHGFLDLDRVLETKERHVEVRGLGHGRAPARRDNLNRSSLRLGVPDATRHEQTIGWRLHICEARRKRPRGFYGPIAHFLLKDLVLVDQFAARLGVEHSVELRYGVGVGRRRFIPMLFFGLFDDVVGWELQIDDFGGAIISDDIRPKSSLITKMPVFLSVLNEL